MTIRLTTPEAFDRLIDHLEKSTISHGLIGGGARNLTVTISRR